MKDRTCCICYENVPCTHPHTVCCKQPIHTSCLQKCHGHFNEIACPMCRARLTIYPNTRGNKHIRHEVLNFMASWDDSMERFTKAYKLATFINFMYDNEHVAKTCYMALWVAVNYKARELQNLIIEDEIEGLNCEEYTYISHAILRCKHNF